MSGPDDRLLQRLAEALSVPAEEPEECELGRLRSALSRWRRSGPAQGSPAGTIGQTRPAASLAPVIFHPPRASGS